MRPGKDDGSAHVYGGKPAWLKIRPPRRKFSAVNGVLAKSGISTVCQEARCPNTSECWSSGTATFMILGDTCTRACRFCAVKTGNPKGRLNKAEPMLLASCVKELNKTMGLNYAVITSVDRDDLPDGGAAHFAESIVKLKEAVPGIKVEVLTPDFGGSVECIKKIVAAKPDVFGHNIETVRRLQSSVRDHRAGYEQSLSVLAAVKKINPEMLTKSSIMLGLGEAEDEVAEAMKDLRGVGVDLLTLGQYLRPSALNLPVVEYVSPERFNKLKLTGERLGFRYVASGPFVRSSYMAGELFMKNVLKGRK